MSNIQIHEGSILEVEADAIVNPANSHLHHGGGLARIIAQHAAPLRDYRTLDQVYYQGGDLSKWEADKAWQREQDEHPLVPTGGAGFTSAGRLPYKGIIHAVGPVWGDGTHYEALLLTRCYHAILDLAESKGFESIAVPAISCGIFGFPVEYAAPLALRALSMTNLAVTIALTDQEHIDAYREVL
jgi:O-acetyl-ADP-ribose deacetylase (regulator of RNase III)